jgi:tetratricopeptide (TPR) repeat protein
VVDEKGGDLVSKKASLFCLFVISILISFPCHALAEIKTFEREYTYQASEADSKVTSRAISLEQVKRLLLEELGTYLESQTEVTNLQMTKDQITTLSAGVVQTVILDESWDGKTYWMKAKIDVDTAEVFSDLDNIRKDRQKSKEYEDLKQKADEAFAEIDKLKSELANTTSVKEKEGIQSEYTISANKLRSKEWVDIGDSYNSFEYARNHGGKVDRPSAILAYTNAISYDPDSTIAYIRRGDAYSGMSNYIQAMKDYDKALEIDPNNDDIYIAYGWFFSSHGVEVNDYGRSIEYFTKALNILLSRNKSNQYYSLDDTKKIAFIYDYRAQLYDALNKYELSLKDLNNAINIYRKNSELLLDNPDAYLRRPQIFRAKIYENMGKYQHAIDEYNSCIEQMRKMGWDDDWEYDQIFTDSGAIMHESVYYWRAFAYKALGNEKQYIMDLQTAAKSKYKDGSEHAQEKLKEIVKTR